MSGRDNGEIAELEKTSQILAARHQDSVWLALFIFVYIVLECISDYRFNLVD